MGISEEYTPMLVIEISINCPSNQGSDVISNVDLVISVYFVVEVFLRIVALTPSVFFSKKSWHNIIDFIVVILAFGATIAVSVIIHNINEENIDKLCDKNDDENNDEDNYDWKR